MFMDAHVLCFDGSQNSCRKCYNTSGTHSYHKHVNLVGRPLHVCSVFYTHTERMYCFYVQETSRYRAKTEATRTNKELYKQKQFKFFVVLGAIHILRMLGGEGG